MQITNKKPEQGSGFLWVGFVKCGCMNMEIEAAELCITVKF